MDEIMCCLPTLSPLSAEEDAPSRNEEFSQSSGMGNVGEHTPLTEKGLTREAGQPADESPITNFSDEAHVRASLRKSISTDAAGALRPSFSGCLAGGLARGLPLLPMDEGPQ